MKMITERQLESINMAAEFAACAHNNYNHTGTAQTRKCGTVPYYAHPAYIATLVALYGGSHKAQIAAYLHDVLEDCDSRWREECELLVLYDLPLPIPEREEIWAMVNALTKNMEITPRSARNANAIVQAINGPKETILVKICDRLANLMQFRGLTLEFLEHTYLPETEDLVRAFEPHVGDYTDAYTALIARMRNVKAIFPSKSIG
jgi:(p)ppGpp synthase/HD superfamily hydrolase